MSKQVIYILILVFSIPSIAISQVQFNVDGLTHEDVQRLVKQNPKLKSQCKSIRNTEICSVSLSKDSIKADKKRKASARALESGCNRVGKKEYSYPDRTTGKQGVIVRTCRANGTWEKKEYLEPITCSGNKNIGDTRSIPCPKGYSGSQEQTCQDSGLWLTTSLCTKNTNVTCSTSRTKKRRIDCPSGMTGYIVQECSNGIWQDSSIQPKACTDITCDGQPIGFSRIAINKVDLQCQDGYQQGGTISEEVCGSDGKWHALGSNCMPVDPTIIEADSSGCTLETLGQKDNYGCPSAQSGEYYRICREKKGNYFWYVVNNCQLAAPTCSGGAHIGETRDASQPCPSNKPFGSVVETCQEDGTWMLDYAACVSYQCAAETHNDTSTVWETTSAGTLATGTCSSGFTLFGATPTRKCSVTGQWGSPSNSCSKACYAINANSSNASHGYAGWTQTQAGIIATSTSCMPGYSLGPNSNITRQCNTQGTWDAPSASCFRDCNESDLQRIHFVREVGVEPHPPGSARIKHGYHVLTRCSYSSGIRPDRREYVCNNGSFQLIENRCHDCMAQDLTVSPGTTLRVTQNLQNGQRVSAKCTNANFYHEVECRGYQLVALNDPSTGRPPTCICEQQYQRDSTTPILWYYYPYHGRTYAASPPGRVEYYCLMQQGVVGQIREQDCHPFGYRLNGDGSRNETRSCLRLRCDRTGKWVAPTVNATDLNCRGDRFMFE